MHANHGEDVVDRAEDEEEGEETEEVVGSFHEAGHVVVAVVGGTVAVAWVHAMMGRAVDGGWRRVRGVCEGLEDEEVARVLHGFGDKEGNDVVEGKGGSKELDDEWGWASWTTCAVGHHEWW